MITRRFKLRLISLICVVLITSVFTAAGFFYLYVNSGLGIDYREKIQNILFLETVIFKYSVFIFIPPALIAVLFIIFTIILYTHRIAGPLVRIRVAVRQVAERNLDVFISFREKDAIKPLANALNNFIGKHKERCASLEGIINDIYRDTEELCSLADKDDLKAIEEKREKILEEAGKVKKIISGLKL